MFLINDFIVEPDDGLQRSQYTFQRVALPDFSGHRIVYIHFAVDGESDTLPKRDFFQDLAQQATFEMYHPILQVLFIIEVGYFLT